MEIFAKSSRFLKERENCLWLLKLHWKNVLLVWILWCELKIVLVCGFVQKKCKKKCKCPFFFVKMKENSEKGGVVHFYCQLRKKVVVLFQFSKRKKFLTSLPHLHSFIIDSSQKKNQVPIWKCMYVNFVQISNHHFLCLHLTFVRINFHILTKKEFFYDVTLKIRPHSPFFWVTYDLRTLKLILELLESVSPTLRT